jgi:hypothetical protein
MNIEKYGNTSACLPLVILKAFIEKEISYFAAFGRIYLGIYLFKMGIRQNIETKKKNNHGFKKDLIKFVSNSGVAEVKLEMDDVKSPSNNFTRR